MSDISIHILEHAGIKPTSNRILVARTLARSPRPLSLAEIEESLDSLDKSSISRVLNLLQSRGVIRTMEDGRGIIKYEMTYGEGATTTLHPHFYCEKCHRVTCLESENVPAVALPEGYAARTVNYMIKGICPDCSED